MATVFMTAQTVTVVDADGGIQQVSASEAGTMTYSQTDGTLTVGGQAVKVSNRHDSCSRHYRCSPPALSLFP